MDPTVLALGIVILLFSVILHEVMHGWVALKFGDRTAQHAGRLTLNPIPHIDLVGTILLPLVFILSGSGMIFGWAKPVPVNPLNFRDIRKGELAVSSAGILANLGLAVIAAILFHLTKSAGSDLLQGILGFAVNINLILAVFNLLPIPPLDGSKIVLSFLPPHMAIKYMQIEKYGFLILLILWFLPFSGTTLLWGLLGLPLGLLHMLLGV
ncbi:MAG: site-2 protease family protein [Patescibacteria group bacterium]|nr:site-2 protease family protein [Patescibacteria group bacterium]